MADSRTWEGKAQDVFPESQEVIKDDAGWVTSLSVSLKGLPGATEETISAWRRGGHQRDQHVILKTGFIPGGGDSPTK